MKITPILKLDTTDETKGEKKLVQLYKKLTDSDKKFLMGWLEGQVNK